MSVVRTIPRVERTREGASRFGLTTFLDLDFELQDSQCCNTTHHSAYAELFAGEANRKHVETFNTARRRAGSPLAGAALLHGRRRPEVLLRGIAQGHAGCWYARICPKTSAQALPVENEENMRI